MANYNWTSKFDCWKATGTQYRSPYRKWTANSGELYVACFCCSYRIRYSRQPLVCCKGRPFTPRILPARPHTLTHTETHMHGAQICEWVLLIYYYCFSFVFLVLFYFSNSCAIIINTCLLPRWTRCTVPAYSAAWLICMFGKAILQLIPFMYICL